MSSVGSRRAVLIAAGAALALAVAMRVNNAFRYTLLWGFDAKGNHDYILRLLQSWELPAPDADWSTAHPPFFYYVSAAICRLLPRVDGQFEVIALRLLISAVGLGIAALAVLLVRRVDPDNDLRALLAGVLVLFLPVHIYMSAMLSEEIVAAGLMSLVLVAAALRLAKPDGRLTFGLAAWLGVGSGLALLTKLTGILVVPAVAGVFALDARRRGELAGSVGPIALMLALTGVVGGWFYARNLIGYGYLYPHGLATHAIMFSMPPGDPQLLDYLRFPVSLFRDPQVLNPDLLRSIWGSTFVSMWFDGHRSFLPRDRALVDHAGSVILGLATLPMAAYASGLVRGARRAVTRHSNVDRLLLAMIAIAIAGYAAFTWRNPWFVTRKASFLLCLAVPFAYYSSDALARWLKRRDAIAVALAIALAVLLLAIVGTFTFSELFWNMRHMSKPGVLW